MRENINMILNNETHIALNNITINNETTSSDIFN